MESEAGDVCAWCKRPLQGRSVYGSFDYVREDDGTSSGDRIMPIFAGIILIGFFVAAGYALNNATRPAATVKPKDDVVAEFGSPKAPIVTSSLNYSSSGGASTPNAQGSKGRPFQSQDNGYAATAQPSSSLARPSQAVATAEGGGVNASLTVTAGRFRVSRTPEGRYILYGEADIDNVGNEPLKSSRFTLTIGEEPVSLTVYSGDIYQPKYVISPEIPVGRSTVYLINIDVKGKILESGRRTLSIDGKNSNGPLSSAILLEP